jgi:uroporphyrinogen decarboxylase
VNLVVESIDRVLAAINHQSTDRIPIDLGGPANSLSESCVRLLHQELKLGTFSIEWLNPIDRHILLSESLLEHFNVDTRHVQPNLPLHTQSESPRAMIVSDWLGLKYQTRGSLFIPLTPPLSKAQTKADIDNYILPLISKTWFQKTKTNAKNHFRNGFAVIAESYLPGPFELCCRLMGWIQFLQLLIKKPEVAEYLLDQALYLNQSFWEQFLEEVGDYLHLVFIGDDYGMETGPFLSPRQFNQFILPRIKKLVRRIKQLASIKILFHSCGAISPLIPSLLQVPIDILSPLQPTTDDMAPKQLKTHFKSRFAFHGGIDLTQLTQFNSTEILQDVKNRIRILAKDGGYIFSLTHTLQDPSQLGIFQSCIKLVTEISKK